MIVDWWHQWPLNLLNKAWSNSDNSVIKIYHKWKALFVYNPIWYTMGLDTNKSRFSDTKKGSSRCIATGELNETAA